MIWINQECHHPAMGFTTRRPKLTYIFTHQIRWTVFEWIATHIDRSKFEVDYLILNPEDPMVAFLAHVGIPCKVTTFKDYGYTPEVVKFIYEHLLANKTDIVHTYWFAGSLAGMQAGYYAKVPVRIFTREHPPIRYTRHVRSKHELIWNCSTHAIAVTNHVKAGMIEDSIPEEKISILPTGFEIKEFTSIAPERIESLRSKYLPHHSGPVIGVAARYRTWKGIHFIIEAHKRVLEVHPDALLVLSGTHTNRAHLEEQVQQAIKDATNAPPYEEVLAIIDHLSELPSHSYLEICFEEDMPALFRLFDVFVHTPIDSIQESFGQVLVETLLSKVPSVITRCGSALDHAVHRENAWIVDYQNSEQIAEGVLTLLANPTLRETIVKNGFKCAQKYSIENHMSQLEALYFHQIEVSQFNIIGK